LSASQWRTIIHAADEDGKGAAEIMDELIDRVATETGADRAVVAKALAVIIDFIAREAPADKVGPLIDRLPGARALIGTGGSGRGLFGVFNDLSGTGLGMGEIQTLARAFLAEARAKVGAKDVDAVVGSVAGLSQFV
jgi:hypothetical protein